MSVHVRPPFTHSYAPGLLLGEVALDEVVEVVEGPRLDLVDVDLDLVLARHLHRKGEGGREGGREAILEQHATPTVARLIQRLRTPTDQWTHMHICTETDLGDGLGALLLERLHDLPQLVRVDLVHVAPELPLVLQRWRPARVWGCVEWLGGRAVSRQSIRCSTISRNQTCTYWFSSSGMSGSACVRVCVCSLCMCADVA